MKRLVILWSVAAILSGCSWFNGSTMRSQSPEDPETPKSTTRLVGDLAVPTGVQPVRVDGVGLIGGLPGTGSDPSPSPQRAVLIDEMRTRNVANPNAVLASGKVAMVSVKGYIRPGALEGERFDIEVRVPAQSETTSLRGGFLFEARLAEMQVLDNEIHTGSLLALAKGPVLVDPTADPKKDRVQLCRGRIPSGGIILKSRPLGLVLLPEQKSIANSSRVATAVNKRFHLPSGNGVAKAKTDEYVDIVVYPRYKENITRYIQVIRALPIAEPPHQRTERIAMLRRQLLDPETSAEAAIQLEAIGTDGVETLLKGIESKNPEVRFYAAEALAYLDRREAAEPLGQIARDEPAFRVFAFGALSAMQDFAASDQLRELLASPSAETRYGAFRSLWAFNEKDPFIKGEVFGDQFHYHVLDVAGPPMIHVTRNRLAEIVVFGQGQKLETPLALNAGNEIMVTSSGGDEISVSKFSVAEGDQKRIVSTRVDDVVRAIVDLGGSYPDVVQALAEAKKCGALTSRFEVDALPEAGRTYDRVAGNEPVEQVKKGAKSTGDKPKQQAKTTPASPSPDLFAKKADGHGATAASANDPSDDKKSADDDSDENSAKKKGFFSKLFGR